MSRAVWFNCFAGIAGDMALGALLDAGADLQYVRSQLELLDVAGWAVEPKNVQKTGISATYANVSAEDEHHTRSWGAIREIISNAALDERVKARSLEVFGVLAKVEARIHDTTPDNVHFHEVGGVDAIVDIVGTCAALESLNIEHVYASPVAIGFGTVNSAHGVLPNPAPAVIALLENVPIFGLNQPFEMTTPTGAAILNALSDGFGPIPALVVAATGYGAGTRDIDGLANCTQVVVGELHAAMHVDSLKILEANLDDITGEVLAHTIARALESGARDAWVTPIVMKKGRPAHMISLLCSVDLESQLIQLLQVESGSLGVRSYPVSRYAIDRAVDYVDLDGEHVRMKVSNNRAKPEFDDAARIAAKTGRSVREVIAQAELLWRNQQAGM